jgi:hypothetical protein
MPARISILVYKIAIKAINPVQMTVIAYGLDYHEYNKLVTDQTAFCQA